MADDFNALHPRIANGTFTDKQHTAPELSLGAAHEPVLVRLQAQWTEKNVLPTPRHTKPRDIQRDIELEVTVPSTTEDEAPVGFVVTYRKFTGRDHQLVDVVETLRVHDGQLYRQLDENVDGLVRPMEADAIAIFRRAFHQSWDGTVHLSGDNPEEVAAEAQSQVDYFLAIDGTLWQKTSEPVYYARTYGLGNNHGSTALHVGSVHEFKTEEAACPEYVFPADQREEAIAYTLALAERRGDTRSLASIANPETIEVADGFTPGSSFAPAPRITYPEPYVMWAAEHQGDRGALERGLAEMRAQLLTVPGAVVEVPDGWGGTTRTLDESKLTEQQAADYKKYIEKVAEFGLRQSR